MVSKFYVVWQGRESGIYTDWNSCKKQVDGYPGARYKSFPGRAEADAAFAGTTVKAATKLSATKTSTALKIKTYSAAEVDALVVDVKIFTDGGCEPNPGKAGSGLAVYRAGQLCELWYGLYNPMGTNNTAELNALHQALIMAQAEIAANRSVVILCDSQYSIQCISQWAVGWERSGWTKKGGEIKNLDLIKSMYAIYLSLKDDVELLHVNGHVGVEGNELADRMSILAIEAAETNLLRYSKPLDMSAILATRAG